MTHWIAIFAFATNGVLLVGAVLGAYGHVTKRAPLDARQAQICAGLGLSAAASLWICYLYLTL